MGQSKGGWGRAVHPSGVAVAAAVAVDNNKSPYCALAGAAQAPRAVDILKISHTLVMTTSSQVRPAPHATQSTPCPRSLILFDPGTSTSGGPTFLHHRPASGSLAAFLDKVFRLDATSGLKASKRGEAQLLQQSWRAFDSTSQISAADRWRQSSLMQMLVLTIVYV